MFGFQRVDGNKVLLAHGGWGIEAPPNTFEQYQERVQDSLTRIFKDDPRRPSWTLDFLKVISENVDPADIYFASYKMKTCQWFNFLTAPVPNNFAAIGDAAMRANPMFGQGIFRILTNVTSLNAAFLKHVDRSDTLTTVPPTVSRDYFATSIPSSIVLFDANRYMDYNYSSTVPQAGETREDGRFYRMLYRALSRAADKDPEIARVIYCVHGGLLPAIDLLHPVVLAKAVFWQFMNN